MSAITTACNFSFLPPRHKPSQQNFGHLRQSGKEGCVRACVRRCLLCALCLCVCNFLNQLSFSPVYKVWGLDLIYFLHRREVARIHFPVCPLFPFVIPQASSRNCLSHPLALSFTDLQSALSPTPSSHLLFPLNMCLIALPSLHWLFFSLSLRLVLIFNIRFITFPAVVFLSLFQTFSLSSLIPFSALSRTVIRVCHPSVIHMDYNSLPKLGFHSKWY